MSWENVSISKFKSIQGIVAGYLNQPENSRDDVGYIVDMYCLLYDKEKDEVLNRPASDIHKLSDAISFINTKPKPRIDSSVVVNGEKYNIPIDVRSITTAQYIDYTEVLRNDPENIAFMCAIFCVPDGMKYNEGYNVSDLANDFEDSFSIVDAIGIGFFFTELLRTYVKSTLSYLEKNLKKELKKAGKNKESKEKSEAMKLSIEALKRVGGDILQ